MTPAGVQGVDGGLYLIILIFFFRSVFSMVVKHIVCSRI